MAFVKIDCGILDSTLWIDRDAREVFLTTLLMAEPREFTDAVHQISMDNTSPTGWFAPPGWYGFVNSSAVGIVRRAGTRVEDGIDAMRRLGAPDLLSRTADFDGRRLIRINGGFVVLNYMKFRDRDYSGAERMQRYRERLLVRRSTEAFGPEWDAVVAFYGGLCAYCETTPWVDMDHVVPTSKGGTHSIDNVVPACKSCNSSKKAQTWPLKRRHPFMDGDASPIRHVTQAEVEVQEEEGTEVRTIDRSTYRTSDTNIMSSVLRENTAQSPNGLVPQKVQGSGAFAGGSLPRDHIKHSICGKQFRICLPTSVYAKYSRRYGPDDAVARSAIQGFVDALEVELGDKSVGDYLWLEKHFDAWLIQTGRVTEPKKNASKFKTPEQIKADVRAMHKANAEKKAARR